VLLSKLPEAILNRKSTQKARLECFLVAMDILRNSTDYSIRVNGKNQKEVEMYGMSVDNKQVKIHLREEITSQKDKRTYFVSCFYKI
jgi:hypothetical protein